MGCKHLLRLAVIPDAYYWMPEPEIPEDVCIGLHIFEAVVSHDISEDKAYYYNVLSYAGWCTSPRLQVWIHRIDKFKVETIWDPECFYLGLPAYAVRQCSNVIGDVL